MSLAAPPELVQSFRDAVAESTGLRFPADKTPMLAELLRRRAEAVHAAMPAYIARLRIDPREAVEVARRLTVSETYFLRHPEQFDVVATSLREREARGIRSWRALSAGCASGEEAYSLAMTLCETVADPEAWDVSILGVDIDPDVVSRARTGIYGSWSLRATPDAIRDRYFRAVGDRFSVVAPLRRMVTFEWQNLVDPSADVWKSAAFDVVFCRNVLMYFAPEAMRRVVARFEGALVPGGALFLGPAEHLRHASQTFAVQHAQGAFYYRRRVSPEVPPEVPPEPPVPETAVEEPATLRHVVVGPPREHLPPRARLEPEPPLVRVRDPLAAALQCWKDERFAEALALLSAVPSEAWSGELAVLRAMLLLTLGRPREAEIACSEWLAHDGLDPAAHYVKALCHEHLGELPEAVESSRTALYLDHAFAMPHLQLGRLARRWGDVVTARRELRSALRLLPHEQDRHVVLFGGGFSRGGLLQVCQAELQACGDET